MEWKCQLEAGQIRPSRKGEGRESKTESEEEQAATRQCFPPPDLAEVSAMYHTQ